MQLVDLKTQLVYLNSNQTILGSRPIQLAQSHLGLTVSGLTVKIG